MNQFSNILKIPSFTDYYKEFMKRIEQKLNNSDNKTEGQTYSIGIDKDQLNAMKQDKSEPFRLIETPKYFITKLKAENYEGLEVKRFDDISPYENKFIIDVNVVDISPQKLIDCLNILCDNCYSTYTVNSIELNPIKTFKCTNCKKVVNGIIHYNMVLHCIENMYTNKIIILHLCTYDNYLSEENIFGIAAVDCYNSEQGLELLNQKIKQLLLKDSYIRVKCEAFQTRDKEAHYLYRIIGEYDQF